MSRSKNTDKVCVLILLLTLVLTTVFMKSASIGVVAAESDAAADEKGGFSERDYIDTWSEKDAVRISLDDLKGFTGNGAYEYEGDLYLVDKGTYVLSGHLKDQQIIVKAKGAKLQIVLNGVELEEDDQAALVVEKADKVFLTLAENTENSISAGTIEDADGVPDAAIYSKSDLSINGKGSLKITTEAGHGIKSKDDLVITNGKITVDAGGNGIVGKDSVRIADGEITITTSVDAVNMN
ncbi:MAG: carbohydrate-binding domain-containing protein, partial [Clostridiales bacterium]|nr:carbohydrate-binding domain-containing protein [Candidatus Blautia equi]